MKSGDGPLLHVDGLARRFGGLVALQGLSLALERGGLLGLIGPNGAGKTTAFNLISGVLAPSGGRILFAGRDVTRATPQERARLGMTRTFQTVRLFDDLSVIENVMAGAHMRLGASLGWAVLGGPVRRRSERAIAAQAEGTLEQLGLLHLAGVRSGDLSYGDRRRVEIARALATDPKLILLDEPAAGMNENESGALGALVRAIHREAGIAVILIEHNVRLVARLCPRIAVLNRGVLLAEGDPDDVLRRPEVVEAYLGRRRLNPRSVGPDGPRRVDADA